MKLGIAGLPLAGKSTLFAALTGARGDNAGGSSHKDTRIATVTVLDDRIDFLVNMYQPKKIAYAKIEYLLPSRIPGASDGKSEAEFWNQIRTCDGLLHVVGNFDEPGSGHEESETKFQQVEDEMILSDLGVVEKRLERIELDLKRGKKQGEAEIPLLSSCREMLEKGEPLRNAPEIATHPLLRGFTFLSAKPMLVLINNEDEDEDLPLWTQRRENLSFIVVRGKLEMDLAAMTTEEAAEFLEAYNIQESALDRIIKHSYRMLNRISFFTVGSDEVKAWPIPEGIPALDAAGEVHSDIRQGFIRAEVVAFDDLKAEGSFQEAKKAGLVRLEGKEYIVKDGDIINYRFNV
jgi:GTP-binding protein YchF